jgi:hypothetical protein
MKRKNTNPALKAELSRIKAEAAKQSRLVTGKADALAAAHDFCTHINNLQPLWSIHPSVVYYHDDCEIIIFPLYGPTFARLVGDLGFDLRDITPDEVDVSHVRHSTYHCMTIESLPGVKILFDRGQRVG